MLSEFLEKLRENLGTDIKSDMLGSVILGYGLLIAIKPERLMTHSWPIQIFQAAIIGFLPHTLIVSIASIENKFITRLDPEIFEKMSGHPLKGRVHRSEILLSSLGLYHYFFGLGTILQVTNDIVKFLTGII